MMDTGEVAARVRSELSRLAAVEANEAAAELGEGEDLFDEHGRARRVFEATGYVGDADEGGILVGESADDATDPISDAANFIRRAASFSGAGVDDTGRFAVRIWVEVVALAE